MNLKYTMLALLFTGLASCVNQEAPQPFGATPSERQLEWHQMKYYAFIHFGLNTFTDREWGYGDESPDLFNPVELDCRQWARVASEAGMEGIVITAKHHDGFCLWPSEFTEHSVKNSPWKNGEGDIIKELREACDEYGLKLGIYLSPWDRHHHSYGKPAYLEYYRNQLRELLTNYGEIFEVWFDGANGGDGFYGGAYEMRRIDNRTYYDWENTWAIVRELQPGAVMFSDGGPDIRWIGNERGYADVTNWCTMKSNTFYPGIGGVNDQLVHGIEDGDIWLPGEVDTSIRPGWFYHSSEDNMVKSVSQLVDIWYHSVGMNGNLILNLPVDHRGLVHENDIKSLMGLKEYIDRAFSDNLAKESVPEASNVRKPQKTYSAAMATDTDQASFWSTPDGITTASIELDFTKTVPLNAILLQEYIPLGQRVKSFKIETLDTAGNYTEVAAGTTIGNRRIISFDRIETGRLKITFEGKASLAVSNIEVYNTPDINLK